MIGQDIISNINGKRGRMIIPQSIGAGTIPLCQSFLIGLDATWHQWEKIQINESIRFIKKQLEIKGGVQFTPTPIK